MFKTLKATTGAALLVLASVAAVPAVLTTTGCACQNQELGQAEQVAATVNGETTISEQTITDFIQSYRASNHLTDDDVWAKYLIDQGFSSASAFRDDAIRYHVRQIVTQKLADENGIEVSDSEIDNQINEVKEYYGYTSDEDWQKQIASIGYTPESYRDYVKGSIIQDKLIGVLGANAKPDDEALIARANTYYQQGDLDGAKKIKCIVLNLDDTDLAAKIAERAKKEDFDKLASEYSKTNEYDAWSYSQSTDSAVNDAVKHLDKGGVTGVVTGAANLFIAKVEDVCHVPDGGFTSVSQIPSDLKRTLSEEVVKQARYELCQENLTKVIDNTQVEKTEMPEGLPYDVDLSKYGGGSSDDDAGGSPEEEETSDDGGAEDDDE